MQDTNIHYKINYYTDGHLDILRTVASHFGHWLRYTNVRSVFAAYYFLWYRHFPAGHDCPILKVNG